MNDESGKGGFVIITSSFIVHHSSLPYAVDRRGVEPRFPGCKPGVVPNWTSSPQVVASGQWLVVGQWRWRMPHFIVRLLATHDWPLATCLTVSPGRIRTFVSWMWARRRGLWTTGLGSDLGWIRTTGLHHVRVASTPLLHEIVQSSR